MRKGMEKHRDEYKKDSDSVKLPVNLVADPRWKPMVKMFVNNPEYRKNLVETVNYSIVYQKDKRLGKYASQLKDFRLGVSDKELSKLKIKLEAVEKEISALKEISSWASER